MHGFHIVIALQNSSQGFVPNSLFQSLPARISKPITRSNPAEGSDYRQGPIRIDWADLRVSGMSSGKAKENRGPAVAAFVPLDGMKTGSTNLPHGIVHFFREASNQLSQDDLQQLSSKTLPLSASDSDGVMLGVLAVPAWMTPSDFLTFVGPSVDEISHLRIIRDISPNRSIVVLKFPKASAAAEFIEAYNGKPFNSMEPEICNVVRVVSVNFAPDDTVSQTIARMASPDTDIYELPTCPVCLERMDSAVTGLITVPCSHTFHCMCLSKWGDSRCPVCRYSQTLRSSHPSSSSSSHPIPFATPNPDSISTCSVCSSTTNLWICLICGNIGCGRYGRAHAHAHYQSTTHLYALELETQRVWDYAGDGYVHRLIQNRADGKLVELPSAAASMGTSPRDGGGIGPGPADALAAEKIEAIGIEYSYLLTSQLDSQRAYYEDQAADLQLQISELRSLLEQQTRNFEHEKAVLLSQQEGVRQEEQHHSADLTKSKLKAENRAEKMTELARKLEKELHVERAVSEGLLKNLAAAKEKAELLTQETDLRAAKIQELEDQLRDVMFFLEARNKIENEGPESEAAGGSLEIVTPPVKQMNKKKKTRK